MILEQRTRKNQSCPEGDHRQLTHPGQLPNGSKLPKASLGAYPGCLTSAGANHAIAATINAWVPICSVGSMTGAYSGE
jgi:hypothetical protein